MLNKEILTFRNVYPPRPEIVAPPSSLSLYERMGFIAQPKLNGSCGVLHLHSITPPKLMGRHNNTFVRMGINKEHLKNAHRGTGYMILVGEYMNKSQKDSNRKLFNEVFVIFDIICYNGMQLINSTFLERQEILDTLYPSYDADSKFDDYIRYVSPSIYRVNNFTSEFDSLFSKIIDTQMYEGFVLKRPDGKLENGLREKNNTGWQLKIRKPTKNYKY
jgi:hypothetical protein